MKRYLLLVLVMTIHVTSCQSSELDNKGWITERLPQVSGQTATSAESKKTDSQDETKLSRSEIITPGKGGANLLIRDTKEFAIKIHAKPSEEYEHNGTYRPCIYSEMHWVDVEFGGDGIYAYLKDGKIYQLRFSSSKYSTSKGLSLYSSPKDILREYENTSNLQEYIVINSGQHHNGGEDLVYWVDQNNGIAFELYYDKKSKNRKVWSIEVFDPAIPYIPVGCVSYPQNLVKSESLPKNFKH